MKLQLLQGTYQMLKLDPDSSELPHKVVEQDFFSITRSPDELSVIVSDKVEVDSPNKSKGWQIIKFVENMDLDLVGIGAKITGVLAENDISMCMVATYNTDYVLVKKGKMIQAVDSLKAAGYEFI